MQMELSLGPTLAQPRSTLYAPCPPHKKSYDHSSCSLSHPHQAGATSGGLLGAWLRMWLPGWNIQPGLYSLMAATACLGGVFRCDASRVRWWGVGWQVAGLGVTLVGVVQGDWGAWLAALRYKEPPVQQETDEP